MNQTAPATSASTPCSSCGAPVAFPPRVLSTRCGYCDTPAVDIAQGRASIDLVAPFRLERRAAVTRLRQWLGDRWMAPEALRKMRVDDRAMEGLMIPAWAVDGIAHCDWRASIGIVWYRTETYRDSDGKTKTRQVREVEWFQSFGTAVDQFDDHISHAGGPIEAKTLYAAGAFDLGFAQPFDERWLSGFVAYAPDDPHGVPAERIAAERRTLAERRIANELLPGDEHRALNVSAKVDMHQVDRALLPIWRLSTEFEGQPVTLWVHGQSGHCFGEVPTSKSKIAAIVVAVLVVILVGLALAGVFS